MDSAQPPPNVNEDNGNLPGPTPTTLEHDLFGDEDVDPSHLTSRAPAVIAREEHDLEELPMDGTMGRLEVSKGAQSGDVDMPDDDEDLDDADGLFGEGEGDGGSDQEEESSRAGTQSVSFLPRYNASLARSADNRIIASSKPFVLPTPILPGQEDMTEEERAYRQRLEYEEPVDLLDPIAIPDGQEQSFAQIELANFGLPAYNKVWFTKLPTFLALSATAFDSLLWDPDDDEASHAGANGDEKDRSSLVPDEYVIRWRWAKDANGNPVKESNARFVRWSDGSLSLQIGSEIFPVNQSVEHSAEQASMPSNSYDKPVPVPALTGHPLASDLSTFAEAPGHGTTFVAVDHPYSGLIETQASVHGTLAITPADLTSATHRRLAGNIARRYEQKDRIKLANTTEDPERKRLEREKADMERQRNAKAKLRQQRATRSGKKQIRRATKLDYGDDSDDGQPMEEDAEGEDDERTTFSGSRRDQPKRGKGGPLAQEEDYDEDGFVVGSGDEEEAAEEAEYSEDEMDAIEQNAEREERRRKEAAKAIRERPRSPAPAVAPRRRLVIDDDEEDE